MNKNTFEIIKIVGISLVLLLLVILSSDLMFKDHPMYYGEWMHFGYIEVTNSFPAINNTAPYCWRLFIPLIVYILPFSVETGFLIVSYLSIIISSILIYYICRHLFENTVYAWIGLFSYFSLIYVVRINVIEFIAVDPAAFMFMIFAIYSVYQRNDLLFVISTTLGMLTKEIIFIVFPLYFTVNVRSNQ